MKKHTNNQWINECKESILIAFPDVGQEYIDESEHQDGKEYWMQFDAVSAVLRDVKMYREQGDGVDHCELTRFLNYVGGLVVADAESMYDSTTYPGEVSDQIEREEAVANYTMMKDMVARLVESYGLNVQELDTDVMTSPMLDKVIEEV